MQVPCGMQRRAGAPEIHIVASITQAKPLVADHAFEQKAQGNVAARNTSSVPASKSANIWSNAQRSQPTATTPLDSINFAASPLVPKPAYQPSSNHNFRRKVLYLTGDGGGDAKSKASVCRNSAAELVVVALGHLVLQAVDLLAELAEELLLLAEVAAHLGVDHLHIEVGGRTL